MRGFWLSGLMALGLSACGHIPGYYPDDEAPRAAAGPQGPKSPPAPPPSARRPAEEPGSPDEAEDVGGEFGEDGDDVGDPASDGPVDEAPPYVPPPKPPRYTPPSTWEPPASPTPPQPTRVAQPVRDAAETADGVKTIRLDADTYYLVDARRNLCFLRHKESMTAVDCAKIVDPDTNKSVSTPPPTRVEPAPAPAPARVEPAPAPAPARVEPAPTPATPTPDETARFEAAFTDIFCDRKRRDETAPEVRIRARGLSVDRYEAIEGWWASDENAWFALTSKAARSCR